MRQILANSLFWVYFCNSEITSITVYGVILQIKRSRSFVYYIPYSIKSNSVWIPWSTILQYPRNSKRKSSKNFVQNVVVHFWRWFHHPSIFWFDAGFPYRKLWAALYSPKWFLPLNRWILGPLNFLQHSIL